MRTGKFLVDYYFTKPSETAGIYSHDIVDKVKMSAYSSDGTNLGDDIDVFITMKDFPDNKKPNQHDLVFFTEQKRFYEVCDYQDAGDFFIISVNKCKQCRE